MQISLTGVLKNGAVPAGGADPTEPFKQPIAWPVGETGVVVVSIVDEAGAPVNISGGTVTLGIRRFAFDTAAKLLRLAVLTTPAAGVSTIAIASADTASWSLDELIYDVWYTAADGSRYQVVPASEWTPEPAVTKSGESGGLAPTVILAGEGYFGVTFDGVTRGSAQLQAFDAASRRAGDGVYVVTVGAPYRLTDKALVADGGKRVIAATNKPGYFWVREDVPNPRFLRDAGWYASPDGHFENDGVTAATAVDSLGEVERRWNTGRLEQNTAINVIGNMASTDANAWRFKVAPFTVTLIGSLGSVTGPAGVRDNTLWSSALTAFQAASATPAADDIQLEDLNIASGESFTSKGLMAAGVIFRRTMTSTRHWFALADLGSRRIRITAPMNNIGVAMSSALTAGATPDPYVAYQMWSIPEQNWGTESANVLVDTLYDVGTFPAPGLALAVGYAPRRRRVWMGATKSSAAIGTEATNCLFGLSTSSANLSPVSATPVHFIGGGFKGSGATVYTIFGVTGMASSPVFQGCQLQANDGSFLTIESHVAFHDATVAALVAQAGSRIQHASPSAGHGFSGKGNTGKLLDLRIGSTFTRGSNTAAAPWVSGSSSDASPILLGSTAYTLADLAAIPGGWEVLRSFPGARLFPA